MAKDGADVLLIATVAREATIKTTDATADEFVVEGDVTENLDVGDTITVSGNSTDNDGEYTVSSVSYASGADETTIGVEESITDDASTGGSVEWSTLEAVAEQTDLTISNSTNMIEANHKGKGHENFLYGKRGGTVSLEALALNPSDEDEARDALESARDDEEIIVIRRRDGSNDIEEAPALVESVEQNFPDDDSSTYSMELQLNDDWEAVA